MIAKMQADQLDELMDLWLSVSCSAHAFIPADYWRSSAPWVRERCFSRAETFLEEQAGRVRGFLSVMPDGYIGALFVREEEQGKGIGGRLLAHCQTRFDRLTLGVYRENLRAVAFYKRAGFSILTEQIDQATGHGEYTMFWRRA